MEHTRLEPSPGSPTSATPGSFDAARRRLIDELAKLERVEAQLHGHRNRILVELRQLAIAEHRRSLGVHQATAVDDPPGPAPDGVLDSVVAEVCALRRLPRGVVEAEFEHSWALLTALPQLNASVKAGDVSHRHSAAIVAEAGPVITAHRAASDRLAVAERDNEPAERVQQLHTEVARTAEARREFDRAATEWATELTPAAVRRRCRRLTARVTPATAEERHATARAARGIRLFELPDGMSELIATIPTVLATAVHHRLSQQATALSRVDGETRTFDQLRADTFADLLLTSEPSAPHASGRGIDAAVAITVPVLSVLGADTEPALLNGVTPIPLEDALRFAAEAPSWMRVLTDPITGVAREVNTYRPSAALRALVGARDLTCRFPGCSRAAHRSDLDHAIAWNHGGTTSDRNLQVLCRFHHSMKHNSGWRVDADASRPGVLTWTSPSGRAYVDHPPPTGPTFTPSSAPKPSRPPPGPMQT